MDRIDINTVGSRTLVHSHVSHTTIQNPKRLPLNLASPLGSVLTVLRKQSRTQDLQQLTTQSQWLALSVSAHKTQATGQIDGYTVLLQPQSRTDELSPEDNDTSAAVDTAARAEPQVEAEDGPGAAEDTKMTELETEHQDQSQSPARRKGFQRFICAEYVDSLT